LASFYYYVRALIEVHGPVIGGITGGIATAWAAWNKGLKPLKDWVIENLAQIREMRAAHPRLLKAVRELEPNGGQSIYDTIRQIQSEMSLLRSLLRAQMANDGRAHFEVSANGTCTWVNREFCLLTASTESENIGLGWHNIIHPDDGERFYRDWKNAMESVRDLRGVYMLANTALGEPPPLFDLTITVFHRDNGAPLGGLGVLEPHRLGGEYIQVNDAGRTPTRVMAIPTSAVREPTGSHRLVPDRGSRTFDRIDETNRNLKK
jgi:PAS domain-containing protein